VLDVQPFVAKRKVALEELESALERKVQKLGGEDDDVWSRIRTSKSKETTRKRRMTTFNSQERIERKISWAPAVNRPLQRRTRSHRSRKIPVRVRLGENNERKNLKGRPKVRKARRGTTADLEATHAKKWLGLHRWMSKRMVMEQLPGFDGKVVPLRPNDKGFRFMQNAARNLSTIHDTSYFGLLCLRIETSLEDCLGFADPIQSASYVSSFFLSNGTETCFSMFREARDVVYLWTFPSLLKPLKDHFGSMRSVVVQDLSANVSSFRLRGHCSTLIIYDLIAKLVTADCNISLLFAQGQAREFPDGFSFSVMAEIDADKLEVQKLNTEVMLSEVLEDPNLLAFVHLDGIWEILTQDGTQAKNVFLNLVMKGSISSGVENEKFADLGADRRVFPEDYPASGEPCTSFTEFKQQREIEGRQQRPKGKRISLGWSLSSNWDFLMKETEIFSESFRFVRLQVNYEQDAGTKGWIGENARIFHERGKDLVGYVTFAKGRFRMQTGRFQAHGFIRSEVFQEDGGHGLQVRIMNRAGTSSVFVKALAMTIPLVNVNTS